MIGRTNSGVGGNGGKGLPEFDYDGTYTQVNEDATGKNWHIIFTSSGTLTFTKLKGAKNGIDVFLVGGGGGGGANSSGGGGGGYTKTETYYPFQNMEYTIIIGDGGIPAIRNSRVGGRGGTTSAFGFEAEGGYGASYGNGGNGANGGSGGGGGRGGDSGRAGNGGTNGSNGSNGYGAGGTGQGTSTRAFWSIDEDPTATLYAGGGGGGGGTNNVTPGAAGDSTAGNGASSSHTPGSGLANFGGGGGAGGVTSNSTGGSGGSGVIIIRNTRI